jgi:hypothetical protein
MKDDETKDLMLTNTNIIKEHRKEENQLREHYYLSKMHFVTHMNTIKLLINNKIPKDQIDICLKDILDYRKEWKT